MPVPSFKSVSFFVWSGVTQINKYTDTQIYEEKYEYPLAPPVLFDKIIKEICKSQGEPGVFLG